MMCDYEKQEVDDMALRRFVPKRTDDLRERCLPYIGSIVHVEVWRKNRAMSENYPEDDLVGFVTEFSLDVPESELLPVAEEEGTNDDN